MSNGNHQPPVRPNRVLITLWVENVLTDVFTLLGFVDNDGDAATTELSATKLDVFINNLSMQIYQCNFIKVTVKSLTVACIA